MLLGYNLRTRLKKIPQNTPKRVYVGGETGVVGGGWGGLGWGGGGGGGGGGTRVRGLAQGHGARRQVSNEADCTF